MSRAAQGTSTVPVVVAEAQSRDVEAKTCRCSSSGHEGCSNGVDAELPGREGMQSACPQSHATHSATTIGEHSCAKPGVTSKVESHDFADVCKATVDDIAGFMKILKGFGVSKEIADGVLNACGLDSKDLGEGIAEKIFSDMVGDACIEGKPYSGFFDGVHLFEHEDDPELLVADGGYRVRARA